MLVLIYDQGSYLFKMRFGLLASGILACSGLISGSIFNKVDKKVVKWFEFAPTPLLEARATKFATILPQDSVIEFLHGIVAFGDYQIALQLAACHIFEALGLITMRITENMHKTFRYISTLNAPEDQCIYYSLAYEYRDMDPIKFQSFVPKDIIGFAKSRGAPNLFGTAVAKRIEQEPMRPWQDELDGWLREEIFLMKWLTGNGERRVYERRALYYLTHEPSLIARSTYGVLLQLFNLTDDEGILNPIKVIMCTQFTQCETIVKRSLDLAQTGDKNILLSKFEVLTYRGFRRVFVEIAFRRIQEQTSVVQESIHRSLIFFKNLVLAKDDLESLTEDHQDFLSWLQPDWVLDLKLLSTIKLLPKLREARIEKRHSPEYELFCFHSSFGQLPSFLEKVVEGDRSFGDSLPPLTAPTIIRDLLLIDDWDLPGSTHLYIAYRRIPLNSFEQCRRLMCHKLNVLRDQSKAWKSRLSEMKEFLAAFDDNEAMKSAPSSNPFFINQWEESAYMQELVGLLPMAEYGIRTLLGIPDETEV